MPKPSAKTACGSAGSISGGRSIASWNTKTLAVRIVHRSPKREKAIEREVDPYKLWYVNNGLYLVGHDHREKALRTFAVERIQSAKLTNRRFEVPLKFNFAEFPKAAFNVIWSEPQEVKIRFSPGQAPYIKERTWHPSHLWTFFGGYWTLGDLVAFHKLQKLLLIALSPPLYANLGRPSCASMDTAARRTELTVRSRAQAESHGHNQGRSPEQLNPMTLHS